MEKYTVKIDDEGSIRWYKKSKLHRLGGPAVEYADGSKAWYQKGNLHRLDGPAVEYVNGYEIWYIDGEEYSQDEFDEITKTETKELIVEEVNSLLKYEVKKVR
jgi:hypothetical protein